MVLAGSCEKAGPHHLQGQTQRLMWLHHPLMMTVTTAANAISEVSVLGVAVSGLFMGH